MGMWTELIFGASLKTDTPNEVIETLKFMIGQTNVIPPIDIGLSRNPIYWGGSYYFGVKRTQPQMFFDDISKQWVLSTRTNIKNYEGDIEKFLDWIKPYIASGSGRRGMYAIVTYEEDDSPEIYYLYDE